MRTKPPTVPGMPRRNSSPAMPGVARGRGDEDAARPAAAVELVVAAAPRPARTPCRAARPRPARRRRGRSGSSRGRAPSPACPRRARARKRSRSSRSAGSNSQSAAPPLLNHTSLASGASRVSLPRTSVGTQPSKPRSSSEPGARPSSWQELVSARSCRQLPPARRWRRRGPRPTW